MARLLTFGLGAAAADVLTLGLAIGAAGGSALAEVLQLSSAIVTARSFESALATTRAVSSPICMARTLASAIDLEET